MSSMNRISKIVGKANVVTETYIDGEGPAFVILPSYGRDSGEDYDDITGRLVRAGWKVLRPQPRGIAGSKGPMTSVSFHDLANEIAAVIRELGDGRAVLLGHAFGHALSRMVATEQPELVKSVILAASQASEVPADIAKTPLIAGDPDVPEADRLAVLRKAFFGPGHDAAIWLPGWYPETLRMQHAAVEATPLAAYWACGSAPMLEVFGAYDPFKPEAYWSELQDEFGGRVTSVRIEGASHALFPEQPVQIADAVLPWAEAYRRAA